jgi:AraC-like DNA-binding protein
MTDHSNIEQYIDFVLTVENKTDGMQVTTVLPDNSIIFGLQFGQPVYEQVGDKEISLSRAGVCGQLTRKKVYLNSKDSETVLVKFKPWSAGLFFNDLPSLKDNNNDFKDLVSQKHVDYLLNNISRKNSKSQAVLSFLSRQFDFKTIDKAVINSIEIINQTCGQIKVEHLAYKVCNSKRNFERKFKATTGLTPKNFIDNVRFQSSLIKLNNTDDLQEIAFLCGYYDLPHFINDFKKITGTTPEKYQY